MAEPKGLEPSTSCVTGRRSNQLNYGSVYVASLRFGIVIVLLVSAIVSDDNRLQS